MTLRAPASERPVLLRQHGRASMDFLVALAAAAAPLGAEWQRDLGDAGIEPDTLPDNLDERTASVLGVLNGSAAFRTSQVLADFVGHEHGAVAKDAFEELGPEFAASLEAWADGPTTLETQQGYVRPAYYDGVWFHRTRNGWTGHDQQGFIHGEIVHRGFVARIFPGDIFAQRRATLATLAPHLYARILELGAGTATYTTCLADAFPDAAITAIDTSRPMLLQAQRIGNARGASWRLIEGAAEESGLGDASFDLVTSFILLHELPEQAIRAIFAEALRVLEPGGTVLMADVVPYAQQDRLAAWRADWSARMGGEPYWRQVAQLDLAALLAETGFVEVEAGGLTGTPYPWIVRGSKPRG